MKFDLFTKLIRNTFSLYFHFYRNKSNELSIIMKIEIKRLPINGMRSLMIGTLLEIIINNIHIITSVTPLNINFSEDSGGSQKTESVKNTTTEMKT